MTKFHDFSMIFPEIYIFLKCGLSKLLNSFPSTTDGIWDLIYTLMTEILTNMQYFGLNLKNEIFPEYKYLTQVLPHLKKCKCINNDWNSHFPISSHFSMIFFQNFKFHDISMTGKVRIIFQGFPSARCCGNPANTYGYVDVLT